MPFKTPEERRAWEREYRKRKYRENPEAARRKARKKDARRRRKPERLAYLRAHRLRTKYGMMTHQWDQMMIEQAGRCAICGDTMTNPQVDHDHATGAVRELLCKPCNLMLGKAREKTAILAAGIDYLNRHHPGGGHSE